MSDPAPDWDELDFEGKDQPTMDASGTPRWVIVFGIILIALILTFIVLQLAGIGGEHGPGRHALLEPQVLPLPGIMA